jgi:hypothetical protein
MEGAYQEMQSYDLVRDLGNWYQGLYHGFCISKSRCWRSPLPEATRWNRYSLDSLSIEIVFCRNTSPDTLRALRTEVEDIERRMTR